MCFYVNLWCKVFQYFQLSESTFCWRFWCGTKRSFAMVITDTNGQVSLTTRDHSLENTMICFLLIMLIVKNDVLLLQKIRFLWSYINNNAYHMRALNSMKSAQCAWFYAVFKYLCSQSLIWFYAKIISPKIKPYHSFDQGKAYHYPWIGAFFFSF